MTAASTADSQAFVTSLASSLVLGFDGGSNGALISVTDTAGNPWTLITDTGGTGARGALGYVVNASAVTSVTISTASSEKSTWNLNEYTGVTAFHTSAHASSAASTIFSTPAVTANAGDLCYANIAFTGAQPSLLTSGFTANTGGFAGSGSLSSARNTNMSAGSASVSWSTTTSNVASTFIALFSTVAPPTYNEPAVDAVTQICANSTSEYLLPALSALANLDSFALSHQTLVDTIKLIASSAGVTLSQNLDTYALSHQTLADAVASLEVALGKPIPDSVNSNALTHQQLVDAVKALAGY